MRIQRLESEKMQLAAGLDKLIDQLSEASKGRGRAEETTSQLQSRLQATEKDRQFLQQEVKTLTSTLNFFRQTICKSVDGFLNRLKLELNLYK